MSSTYLSSKVGNVLISLKKRITKVFPESWIITKYLGLWKKTTVINKKQKHPCFAQKFVTFTFFFTSYIDHKRMRKAGWIHCKLYTHDT
jgi:hypothetical protein